MVDEQPSPATRKPIWVKRLWLYIDYLCEKYLKANKEFQ